VRVTLLDEEPVTAIGDGVADGECRRRLKTDPPPPREI
jgi:hypothetical protein